MMMIDTETTRTATDPADLFPRNLWPDSHLDEPGRACPLCGAKLVGPGMIVSVAAGLVRTRWICMGAHIVEVVSPEPVPSAGEVN